LEKEPQKRKFLFNVDIMIEEDTNGRALEKLLQLLNSSSVEDYQVKQGIELGKKIEVALKQAILKDKGTSSAPDAAKQPKEAPRTESPGKPQGKAQESGAQAAKDDPHRVIWEQLQQLKESNKLIRLTVVKGKGVKLSIPCRILSTDPSVGNVTVYHVDEKKVYLFKINEIDDFTAD
jgi:hypothetical protein